MVVVGCRIYLWVGCVYEILEEVSSRVPLVFNLEASRVSVGGYVFSMGENKEYLRNFDDYFISIEDYRDRLIDEIL